ncbi:MAG TPA: hypothetical protein VME23_20605 [Terracidiphilus sp.]|nr:hypothetical protein [Terracidiphilus sp.]
MTAELPERLAGALPGEPVRHAAGVFAVGNRWQPKLVLLNQA